MAYVHEGLAPFGVVLHEMLINAKIGKHAYLLDRQRLPLQPEFEDNEVAMDPSHPSLALAHAQAEAAAEGETARAAPPPQFRTREDHMSFLVSTIQGMDNNIFEILLNQKILERIVETKFHDLDIKVTELATTVEQLKHEVDAVHTPRSRSDHDDLSLATTTQFRTQTRCVAMPVPEARPSSSAQASALSAPSAPAAPAPPVSTPPPQRISVEAFVDVLLSPPSNTIGGDRAQSDDEF
uniref:Uncharacterized protein n=1 Tax=Hordeum vulgare subsp. vulgare TaxID=112509 RepID=A0A023IN88_HORVV|nr:hypothetical protein [Hordeum vulgare subsp. vulgare]QGH59160.1 hypothetical protein [Hordeum vulgare subsp. vulgare]